MSHNQCLKVQIILEQKITEDLEQDQNLSNIFLFASFSVKPSER